MPRYKLLVLSNAVAGREEEFNEWYTGRHLADVRRVPGVVAAERFRAPGPQLSGEKPQWAYMAIYDCETDDIQALIATLKARTGTPDLPMSDAFDPAAYACFYEPIGS